MQINRSNAEKLIFILFLISLFALFYSFSESPPGTLPQTVQSCATHEIEVRDWQIKIADLKKKINDCQIATRADLGSGSTSKLNYDKCQRRIIQLQNQIKALQSNPNFICDDQICQAKLKKCLDHYQTLKQAIQKLQL